MNISQDVLAAGLLVLCGAIGYLIKKIGDLSDRILILETTMKLIGCNAAHALHSPHTPILDNLLEKYINRHYELTYKEWEELVSHLEAIMEDKTESTGYRNTAGLLAAICHHKLGHDISKVKRILKDKYE